MSRNASDILRERAEVARRLVELDLELAEAIASRDTATAMGLASELGVDTTSETWAAEATAIAVHLLRDEAPARAAGGER